MFGKKDQRTRTAFPCKLFTQLHDVPVPAFFSMHPLSKREPLLRQSAARVAEIRAGHGDNARW